VQDKIIKPLRWLATFGLFNILAFLVSSESVSQWLDMLRRIVTMKNMDLSEGLLQTFYITEMKYSLGAVLASGAERVSLMIWLILGLGICLIPENNYKTRNRLSAAGMLGASVLFWWALLSLGGDSTFVYYGF
jgi:alginate O-acetyltransferase complex protein AlgI